MDGGEVGQLEGDGGDHGLEGGAGLAATTREVMSANSDEMVMDTV